MSIRSPLLAAGLGVLALAGCGGDDRALIPPDTADRLVALVEDAGQLAAEGDCDAARRTARDAQRVANELPRRADRDLRRNLEDWLAHLEQAIADECSAEPEETATAEPTETATPAPTATATPTETATPSPTVTVSPAPTTTVDPGTGGVEPPPVEPDDGGGVGEEDG